MIDQSVLPNVTKPRSIRKLCAVDTSSLLPLVNRISDQAWAAEDGRKENGFDCFHHTKHLIFRFINRNREAQDFYSNPSWDVWRHLLQPIMDRAIIPYGLVSPVFPKVMLARLAAGSHIDPHVDGAGSNLQTHKIHVPLVTNSHAVFESGGEKMHLEFGYAYEVNNIVTHAAKNGGPEDRIHLIFEVFDLG